MITRTDRIGPRRATLGATAALCLLAATPVAGQDIVDVAASNPEFSTLVTAVKAAGLAETLKGEGPFTVFAPTNAAFEALPDGTLEALLEPENRNRLTAILTYHVLPGKVMASRATGLSQAKTAQGQSVPLAVREGALYVGGAKVIQPDIEASNGVIHVIDGVILPPPGE